MRMLLAACLLTVLTATGAMAQNFGPKGYPDCMMLYVKKAASRDGAMLTRLACKCRFQDATRSECKPYSPQALDCMIKNLGPVEHDEETWGVERVCRTKFPAK